MSTPNTLQPGRSVLRYPTGMAWAAGGEYRIGRYVTCPNDSSKPFGLGVVDNFGDLVTVPSLDGVYSAFPATGVEQ